MTPEDLIVAWQELRRRVSEEHVGPYLHLQVLGGHLKIGVIVRAEDGCPGLLVRVTPAELGRLPLPDSGRGFSFGRPVPAGIGMLGFPILVADPAAVDLFAVMGADLVAEAERSDGRGSPIDRVLRRISLWRSFLQQRGGLMTEEERRGLFGELHVLALVAAVDGTDAALEAWNGPTRELHDFRFPDGLLEVKSWRSDSGARLYISRADQIFVDSGRPLHVAAVKLSIGSPEGSTLREIVSALRDGMNVLQAQRLDELLAEYGYLDAHAEQYPERMQVVGLDVFEAREGFPHLDVRLVPGGVVEVRYAIELGSLDAFRATNRHLGAS